MSLLVTVAAIVFAISTAAAGKQNTSDAYIERMNEAISAAENGVNAKLSSLRRMADLEEKQLMTILKKNTNILQSKAQEIYKALNLPKKEKDDIRNYLLSTIRALHTTASKWRSISRGVLSQTRETARNFGKLKRYHGAIKAQMKRKDHEVNRCHAHSSNLQRNLNRMKAEMNQLNEKIEELKSELEKQEAELEKADGKSKAEMDQLNEKIQELKSELEKHEEALKKANGKYLTTSNELTRCGTKLDHVKANSHLLSKKLHNLVRVLKSHEYRHSGYWLRHAYHLYIKKLEDEIKKYQNAQEVWIGHKGWIHDLEHNHGRPSPWRPVNERDGGGHEGHRKTVEDRSDYGHSKLEIKGSPRTGVAVAE